MKRSILEPNRVADPTAGNLPGKRKRVSKPAISVAVPTLDLAGATPAATLSKNSHNGEAHAVRFEVAKPLAHQVQLAGTFNNWEPEANPMIAHDGGDWVVELMLRPGRYEYRFVVDGQWQEDPKASIQLPNPFGGMNSVIEIGAAH